MSEEIEKLPEIKENEIKIEENVKIEPELNENDIKTEENVNLDENPVMSKRQKKKLIKMELWEVKKKEKRLLEREKYKRKRIEAIEAGLPRKGPSRKELKRKKFDFTESPATVCIDLSFDELMIDKDISKCVKQLLRVYTLNRRSDKPINLYMTGIKEGTRTYTVLEKNDGWKNWNVQLKSENYSEVFDKSKIVYLTSDSETVLTELDKASVYIIGGLVDHNQHKGICHKTAEELGFKTARLPLSENVVIKTRTVLTIDHVFEILLQVSGGKNWQEAILNVIPMRKGAIAVRLEEDSTSIEIDDSVHDESIKNETELDKNELVEIGSS